MATSGAAQDISPVLSAEAITDYQRLIQRAAIAPHIQDYAVYVSELPSSGDFNIVLVVRYAKGEDMQPSRERYDAFMKAWGSANEGKVREIVKNYPAMREITGEYVLREITFK